LLPVVVADDKASGLFLDGPGWWEAAGGHRSNCAPLFRVVSTERKGGTTMQTLAKIAATLGVVGAMAAGTVMPASAVGVYIGPHGVYFGHRHHHYYNSYDGGGYTYNGCRPGWTVQGGNCAPYKGPVGPGWGWYR
jgi:hypothetical protein